MLRPGMFGGLASLALLAGCTTTLPGGADGGASASGSGGGTGGTGGSAGMAMDGGKPPDGGKSPDGAGPDAPGPAGMQPLSGTTFVFERRLLTDGGTWISHLYTYDLANNTERLLSKLEHQGRSTDLKGLAVSPDRKWIAFTEWELRPSQADSRQSFVDGIIWVMNVAGGDVRRLTMPALPDLNQNGVTCALDRDCMGARVCVAARCTYQNFISEYLYPAWAPDGQSIFVTHWQSWSTVDMNGAPALGGGGVTASVPFAGGSVTSYGVMGCSGKTPIAFHPDGRRGVVGLNICSNKAVDGFHEYTLDPFTYKGPLADPPSIYAWATTRSIAWMPDGSGFLYTGYNTRKAQGDGFDGRRQGLYFWDATRNQHQIWFEATTDDLDITDLALSRDGKTLILATSRPVEGGFHNEFARFELTTRELRPLPLPHAVIRPRW
jgi:hypothetical protein